jgi:putative aldouronate transport system substrate-binding protein
MKMKKIMVVTAALAVFCMLAVFSACQKNQSSGAAVSRDPSARVDPLNQSEKMKVRIATLTGFTQPDSRTEKWLEDRYNIDIEIVALPGWSDSPAKISLLMADDAQRPDIVWWWGMDADFAKWKDAGLLVDLTDYMGKYTVMRDYFNSMDPKTLYLASSAGGRTFRIPGDVSEPSCETLWIRQDWLDNLGLKAPTTLAELEDVLYKFTFNDPDGNGKNDTYGLGGDGYDFRSFWPWIQGSGQGIGDYAAFIVQPDGSYAYGPATEDAKTWLGRVAKLYADGVITPNIINDTDRDEEMARGGFGVAYTWIAYNNPSHSTMRSFYASNPNAKWVPLEMVKGDNGNPQDEPATSSAWCYFTITKSSKDPERLYAIWDDMAKPENYITRRFGLENKEWTRDASGTYTILVPNNGQENQAQNIGMSLFEALFSRKDFCNIENTPSTTALFERAGRMSRDYSSILIEKKDPNAYVINNDIGSEIGDIREAFYWSVISGTRSINEWNRYIADLNTAGLDRIMAELKSVYDGQRIEQQQYLAQF